MRNLKKTLCLILALVFVLGLCAVSAADTTLADISKVNADYVSAVKALTGLGIISGFEDGTFRPAETVTRAQAAKFIAYICLGENAEKYVAKQVFDDVAKDHWASKYIAYCANNNIINGYGNGKFGPNDNVTQAQLCKMLLAAAGYGAKDEFTGKDWDANVAEYAFKTKLIKNLDNLDWEAAATREEAALLSYNTLMRIPQVALSKDLSSYVDVDNDGVNNYFATEVWEMFSISGIVTDNVATGLQLTQVAGWFDVKTEKDADPTLIGHEVDITYTVDDKGNNIAYFIDDTCEEVSFSKLAKGKQSVAATGYANNTYVNGVNTGAAITFTGAEAGKYIVRTADNAIIGYKDETFFLAELYKTAAGKWAVNDGTERLLTLVPPKAAVGDVVAVKLLGTVYSASATTKQEGVLVKQYNPANVTWNNGAISFSTATGYYNKLGTAAALFTGNDTDGNAVEPSANATYTVYGDGFGGVYKVVKTVAKVNEKDVFLVTAYTVTGAKNEYGEALGDTYYAQVIGADGKIQELKTGVTGKGNDYEIATPLAKNNVYAVTTDANGFAVLSAPVTYTVGTIASNYTATYSKDARYDFNDAVLAYYSGSKSTLKVALDKAIDGTGANGKFIYAIIARDTTTVNKVVAVWFDKPDTPVVVSTDYIFVCSSAKSETKVDADGKSYDYYPAFQNGAALNTLKLAAGTAAPAIGFYTNYAVKADGTYVLGTPVATATYDLKYKPAATDPTYLNFIMDGKLYTSAETAGMDLTGVVIIDLTGNKIGTAADLEAALASPTYTGKTFTIEFVEIAGKVKSFGGKMIILKAVA